MADKAIVNYIIDGMRKGYTSGALRAYLVQQGYNPAQVDAAITEATGSGGKKFFVFLFLLIVIIGGGLGAAYMMGAFTKTTAKRYIVPTAQDHQSDTGYDASDTGVTTSRQQSTAQKTTTQKVPTEIARTSGVSTATTSKTTQTYISSTVSSTQIQSITTNFGDIRSINDCETYPEEARDRCILEFSWNKDHITFCDRISQDGLKDECFSRYALKHEDKQTCDKVENKYAREICVYFLLTADKLKELDVEYTIDAKTPEIIYDQNLAMKKLQSKIAAQELELKRQMAEKQKASETAATIETMNQSNPTGETGNESIPIPIPQGNASN